MHYPAGWIDPLGWFCGSSQKHHPIPQFLGGNKLQNLIQLAKNAHVEMHNALNERLKSLFNMRGGGPGGGANDWAREMAANPGMQKKLLMRCWMQQEK